MARRGEKKVADWPYDDGKLRVHIPVMMVDGRQQPPQKMFEDDPDGHNNRQSVGTYFRVRMEDPDVWDEDTNIDALKTRVMAKIKARLTIEWRTMLLVEVTYKRARLQKAKVKDPDGVEESAEVGLNISWQLVQIAEVGKGTKSQKFHRTFDRSDQEWTIGAGPNSAKPSGKYEIRWNKPQDGWPDTGGSEDDTHWNRRYRQDPTHSAMIPDTPANREALEQIASAVEALGGKLTALLGVGVIENTLAAVAAKGLAGVGGAKLLGGPDDAEKRPKKARPESG